MQTKYLLKLKYYEVQSFIVKSLFLKFFFFIIFLKEITSIYR